MFRLLELGFLDLVAWFFTSHGGAAISLTIFTLLIGLQFLRTGATIIPGAIGFLFLLIACFQGSQIYSNASFATRVHEYQEYLVAPKNIVSSFPIVEPILSNFVAPVESRTVWEELVGIFFLTYLGFVAHHALAAYKETKKVIDWSDFSPAKLFVGGHRRPTRSRTNELGSGDLAGAEQIGKWTKPSGKTGDTSLEVTNLRGSEGTVLKQGKLVWPQESRNRHILIVAKTGSGKSTRLIYPVIYNDCMCKTRSTIVVDAKPEMWGLFASMTKKYNPHKNIMLFNPLEIEKSLSWNILSKIQDDTDCKLIANTIIMATDVPGAKMDSPFFRNNALAILNSIMVGLLSDSNDVLSMPRIHELVQSGMKPLCAWLEAHPKALRNTRTFVELSKSGSQNADTIMSELSMRLSAWDLKAVRATTSLSELDLERLVKEPTLLVVEFRESEIEMLRPMANVIVVEILRFLTKYAEKCPGITLPRPVSLVIDEFASALGKLPDIEVKLNTLRSRNVSIVAAIQSTAQIKALYGDHADSVLAGFSTKIFMPALDLVDSEWASKESGQMTIRFKTASVGSNKRLIDFWASKNDTTQEQVQQRAVLTPDEIGRPVDNIATFFMPNTPVFQGFLTPHFLTPEMYSRIKEFASEDKILKLRDHAIEYEEKDPEIIVSSSGAVGPAGLPPGITNTAGWSEEEVRKKLEEVKVEKLEWNNTTGSARKWWEAFENENKTRIALVLRLGEELSNRKSTITDFFLAYVYSNTENIQANLHYLDYTRLKKDEEEKKKGQGGAAAA